MATAGVGARGWLFLKWLIVIPISGVVPLIAYYVFMTWGWDFSAAPGWAWIGVSLIPLAATAILFFPPSRQSAISRLACIVMSTHVALMAGMLAFGLWRPIAGMALLLDLLLITALLMGTVVDRRPPGRFAKATIVWIAALFGLGVPLALANGLVVAWRAESIAGDRPYCIQYASQTDAFEYEPAHTLFDLSALKMQTRLGNGGGDDFYFQNHALLVVEDGGRHLFNWSYQAENFLDEAVNHEIQRLQPDRDFGPKIICHPAPHYAAHLPIWRREPITRGLTDSPALGEERIIPTPSHAVQDKRE